MPRRGERSGPGGSRAVPGLSACKAHMQGGHAAHQEAKTDLLQAGAGHPRGDLFRGMERGDGVWKVR